MGYPSKIQQIKRKDFNQYYINFPRVIALAMNFSKADPVELEILDKQLGKSRIFGSPGWSILMTFTISGFILKNDLFVLKKKEFALLSFLNIPKWGEPLHLDLTLT
jgi:hypothetical protein